MWLTICGYELFEKQREEYETLVHVYLIWNFRNVIYKSVVYDNKPTFSDFVNISFNLWLNYIPMLLIQVI